VKDDPDHTILWSIMLLRKTSGEWTMWSVTLWQQ